ncbi:SDR family NAD(P)-dependent oxidoreductase [Andreprevotia chitinilytica]|uniref:SDR family NAD(P)-dependent oxidoreductase n=1 Tax=Andreprevotia chitinilytica TaxID=396808 RepID=UPI00055562FC|nr:SDR family NAD(P)-dependent oxidoreductase [Andreprevotia chitinilytica]
MLLEGKTVIVTGGSRGIGRAVAVGCAKQGANVVVSHHSHADEVLADIDKIGGKAVAVQSDIADPATGTLLVNAAVKHFGSVDVLVSNAGICPFHSFLDMPVDVLKRTMEVNLHGAFYVTQAAANRMKDQGRGGAIIAVSSISALVGGEMQTHYTPTKAGVHSLMQSCAIALGKYGIRCNSVLPGTILTDINKDDLADADKLAYMQNRIPLGRLGEPEDLAGPVVFLASDMARYVTGAALLVDGGLFVNLQ